ncbi:hypothetical protein Hanom_Chr09g00851501 [Helianthus anomalus]
MSKSRRTVATRVFSRRSFEFEETSITAISSTIRPAEWRPLIVILLKDNNRLECDENATIDNLSDDESDNTIDLIAFLIICNFSFVILPLTSTTVTKSIGALRQMFSGASGAFTVNTIAYVSCLRVAAINVASGNKRTSTSLT